MAYDSSIGIWLSRDPSGIAGGPNPYEAFNDDPINWDDPNGLAPQPATQPASAAYGGTFLDNMTPAAASALSAALIAAGGGNLTHQQALSIPLTDADASIYLQAMGKSFLYVTPGMMRDALEKGTAPGYAEDSYADALKKNPALGMTRDQYYKSLAAAHNIEMAKDVMQMSGNAMANLYARLAMPTANLIAASVMAPTAIPPGGAFYTPGFGAVVPRALPIGITQPQFADATALINSEAAVANIGGEIVVQGSRAAGTAGIKSDIDFAIRVSPEQFDRLVRSSFGTPNQGSAAERTMLHAIETGKITSSRAGLSSLRDELQTKLGVKVDISVIKKGGSFDRPPFVPVPQQE